MCGICGSSRADAEQTVTRMSAALTHRGPDESGMHVDTSGRIAVAARRLSIIDIEHGHQPCPNEDRSVWAVLNGEIYNHPALIERLLANGHQLRSRSDTEVLVHLYEEMGADLVHALEGMFAFAVWDERKGKLLLARDRFGEKPLFAWEGNGDIAFASELTALRHATPTGVLRPESVDSFFVFGYVPGPETMIEGIRSVPAGHLIEWTPGGTSQQRRYWRPPRITAAAGESERDLQAEAIRLLDRSLRQTMVSDAPLGIFISGGVDSALIAALAARIGPHPPKTFTVGYDVGEVSELAVARRTAKLLGADHHQIVLTADDVRRRAPSLLHRMDQPLADQALIALNAISEEARGSVKVAVGGQGADELFGGYPRYRWIHRSDRISPRAGFRVRSWGATRYADGRMSWGRREQLATMFSPRPAMYRHVQWATKGRINARAALYGERLASLASSDQSIDTCRRLIPVEEAELGAAELMELDRLHWLPDDVLMMADRAGMLASLEIRTPYLSREVAEFATTVRMETHVAGNGKRLLRNALAEFESVPRAVTQRRKVAFRAPGAAWLRGPLRDEMLRHVNEGPLVNDGWIERREARRMCELHLSQKLDLSNVLWPMLVLGYWLEGSHASF